MPATQGLDDHQTTSHTDGQIDLAQIDLAARSRARSRLNQNMSNADRSSNVSSPRKNLPGTDQSPTPEPTEPAPTDPAPVHPVDESRPLGRILLFGIQHVLVMAATPISAVFLMSASLGLDPGLTVNLLSAAFVLSGVGSLIQSLGPWKFGPRLPFVMLPGVRRSSSSSPSPNSTACARLPAR